MFLGSGLRLSRRGQTGNDEVNAADCDIGHVLDGRFYVLLHLFGHDRDPCAKGDDEIQGQLCRAVTHFDRDLFTYFPDAEMPDRPSAVRFTIGADGRADSVTIESLDANGLGTLPRAE